MRKFKNMFAVSAAIAALLAAGPAVFAQDAEKLKEAAPMGGGMMGGNGTSGMMGDQNMGGMMNMMAQMSQMMESCNRMMHRSKEPAASLGNRRPAATKDSAKPACGAATRQAGFLTCNNGARCNRRSEEWISQTKDCGSCLAGPP